MVTNVVNTVVNNTMHDIIQENPQGDQDFNNDNQFEINESSSSLPANDHSLASEFLLEVGSQAVEQGWC